MNKGVRARSLRATSSHETACAAPVSSERPDTHAAASRTVLRRMLRRPHISVAPLRTHAPFEHFTLRTYRACVNGGASIHAPTACNLMLQLDCRINHVCTSARQITPRSLCILGLFARIVISVSGPIRFDPIHSHQNLISILSRSEPLIHSHGTFEPLKGSPLWARAHISISTAHCLCSICAGTLHEALVRGDNPEPVAAISVLTSSVP